jgi:signal transduction histidine kinase
LIQIKATLLPDDEDFFLQFEVFDNGPGITPEDQRKLFKPFSKLRAHQHLNPNGSGLGLHICHMIVTQLGGDIWIESEPENWTKFSFKVRVKAVSDFNLGDCLS